MRSKEVENAIERLKNGKNTAYFGSNTAIYFIKDVDTALSYIETLEQLPNKIRDKIKELEEDKQTILQAIEEAKESKDEEFLKYNREILYRINGEISVLKSIIGE